MVPYAKTANLGCKNYTRSRPCQLLNFKSVFHDYGRNVNVVKVLCIRYAGPLSLDDWITLMSMCKEVLCSSKDCPIFYMRNKGQKDVEDVTAVLKCFDGDDW